MGLFREPAVEFEAVIDTDGVIWPAYTDDRGVLWIDDEDVAWVVVAQAIVGGVIYDAWVDHRGRLRIDI